MKQSKTMELKKPVRVSLARQVLTAMESMIRSGKWKVGDRIPAEAELARAFSVSHNTIREALQSLIHMGMLEARPGDGTYVMASDRFAVAVSNRLKESELPQILEARLALEKEIARLAAVKRTDEDLKELENALEDCHGRVRQGIEDDMLFHAAVARATHNPVLSELYNVVIRHVQENLEKLLQEKQYDSGAMKLHDDLLAAIRNQEADEAENIIVKIVEFDTVSIGGHALLKLTEQAIPIMRNRHFFLFGLFSKAVRRNEIGEQESRTGMNNSERKSVAFCIHW